MMLPTARSEHGTIPPSVAHGDWPRLAVLVLAVSLAIGCGSSLSSTVTGRVTLDGGAIPSGDLIVGTVTFYPVVAGAAAYADLERDGTYRLRTGGASGLAPGEFKVGVRLVEVEAAPPGGYKDAPGQRLLNHPRYEDPDQSGLQFTVVKGVNEFNLALTSH